MGGDNSVSERSSDAVKPPNGPHFGVDLANPRQIREIQPKPSGYRSGERDIPQVHADVPPNHITIKNEGPIGAVSLPPGWTEMVPPPIKPGWHVEQFQVKDGRSFVPPDHDKNPSVRIHIGPGLQSVPPQAESAFRGVLQAKPAISGPQELTEEEFRSLAGIIRPFDGGNNQYHDTGTVASKFAVESASTVNINGKTALLVKGRFLEGAEAGHVRESIYIDNRRALGGSNIEQIYLTTPPEKMRQYEQPFRSTVHSIRWGTGNGI